MIYIAPVRPETQRRLTTGLASIGDKNMYVFNPVFKARTVSLIRSSGDNKFQIDEAA